MATYRALINGVDRADTHVLLDGFKINEVTNGINTLVCRVGSEDASYRPVKRQEIEIYENDGTSPERLIFGGTLRMVREHGWGQTADGDDSIVLELSADSYKTLASRRFVTASIPSGTLKAALQVIEPYLTAYGVTLDPAQANGPTLEAIEFEVVRVDDCLNFFATLTAKYGAPFIWTIDYGKTLGMYQTGTVPAPWDLLESDFQTTYSHQGDIEVEPTDESYANKIIVVWGSGTVVAVSNEVVGTGNGVQTVFPLAFQLVGPGIPGTNTAVGWGYVTRATIFFETLGDLGTGAMWEYDPVANTITRTIGAPAVGEVITISYHGESKGTVTAQDAGEIASFGLWEDKILAPEIENEVLAQALADAELARRLVTGRIVRFQTTRLPGPVPGETITITVPKRNITGSFTVTDVATENEPNNANTLIRTVTCNSNIHEQSHQTLTRWWSEKDTNGIAMPAGSGAVPGPPPYSVQWNDSTSGQAIFGGAYHVLYYDLFWDQPDAFTSPPEVRTKGLLFVTNQHLGAAGHIGITDPQRLEMGMLGDGDFSMDLFSPESGSPPSMIPAVILMNSPGNIVLTAGTPVGDLNWGQVSLVGGQNHTKMIGIIGPGAPEPGVFTTPGTLGESFSRFAQLNVHDGIAGLYRNVSSLPFSIQVTPNEDTFEFQTYWVTAGTGTIFLPWIGSAGTPNYRSFPVTAVGRMYWIVNDGGGTLTVDAGTAGTNINDAASVTLADKAAIKVQRTDDGWRILAQFGTVTGGGAGGSVTIGGDDKDVQFNDGGVLGGEDAFEWDKTKTQLAIDRSLADSQLRLSAFSVGSGVIAMRASDADSEIAFGWERIGGSPASTLVHNPSPGTLYWTNVGGSPSVDRMALEINPGETPGNPAAFAFGRGIDIHADGVATIYQYGGLGAGQPGMGLQVFRNTSGAGAAGFVALENLDGVPYYLWHDEHHIPRWGSDPPVEGGGSPTVGDMDGLRLSPEMIVIAESDDSDTDNTVHNDPELFLPIEANTVYLLELFLMFNTGTSNTPDAKINFTLPASATLSFGGVGLAPTATVTGTLNMTGEHQKTTPTTELPLGVLTTASIPTSFMPMKGVLRVGATAGTLQLQWAQNTTTGGTPTVRREDSYLRLTKVRTT